MAVRGPDTPALGVRENLEVTLSQTAATAAALLGHGDYADASEQIAPPLPDAVKATHEGE